MEAIASIATKFRKLTKRASWAVQIRAQRIQDGERPPFRKIIEKLPYRGNGLSADCHEIWHGEAVRPSWRVRLRPLKIWNLKIQDGGGRHLKNRKIHISAEGNAATVWPIATKIGILTPLSRTWPLKNKDGARL